MSKVWLRAVPTVAVILGGACATDSGSGNIVSRQIEVTPFSNLQVSGTFTVSVSVGNADAVSVRLDDNLVDAVDVGVSGDTLHVGLEQGTSVTNATLEADVTVQTLGALEVSGSSRVTLSDPLTFDTLTVTVSGASRLTGPLEIDEGIIQLDGASNAELSGSATTLAITQDGASQLQAAELTIDELTIDLGGASEAEVSVTGSLSADASGASTLRYEGSPTIIRSDAQDDSTIERLT